MFSGMNYVYEVYKEQSFSKAAENLYISQPALSSMIKKIETKIGMPLFDPEHQPHPADGMRQEIHQDRRENHGPGNEVRLL